MEDSVNRDSANKSSANRCGSASRDVENRITSNYNSTSRVVFEHAYSSASRHDQPAGQFPRRASSKKRLNDPFQELPNPEINNPTRAGVSTLEDGKLVHATLVDHVASVIADRRSPSIGRMETTYNRKMSRDGFSPSPQPTARELRAIEPETKIEAPEGVAYTSAKKHPFEVKSRPE